MSTETEVELGRAYSDWHGGAQLVWRILAHDPDRVINRHRGLTQDQVLVVAIGWRRFGKEPVPMAYTGGAYWAPTHGHFTSIFLSTPTTVPSPKWTRRKPRVDLPALEGVLPPR